MKKRGAKLHPTKRQQLFEVLQYCERVDNI